MKTTIIIPIHEYNDIVSGLLEKSINSIVKQENVDEKINVIVIYPPEISVDLDRELTELNSDVINIIKILNDGKTDYQSQVNLAVKSVTTEYFSVLEFDDEYGTSYLKNVEKYVKAYSDIDIFLTMMIEVNDNNEGIKLTNETVWAQQFVGENGEVGYLNANALKQYTDFKLSGAVIKTKEFINIGGYKSNIKLTFMYEYLLRALNNANKIFSIPKIGYKHYATREGSMFNEYLKSMPVDERKFWFETAVKESNFINDRPINLPQAPKIVEE